MKRYGINPVIWDQILKVCLRYPEVSRVILYGSRARGDYKPESDIDIAIDAPLMSSQQFATLWNELDDLPIVYSLDIIHLQNLKNPLLLNAINQDGIIL